MKLQLKGNPRNSPDRTKMAMVVRGQRITDIAYQQYGDPTQWRAIADANSSISNPRFLDTGATFRVPSLQEEVRQWLVRPPALAGTPPPPPAVARRFLRARVPAETQRQDAERFVQDILSVTFHDSLKDVDSVEIQVNNWDPGEPIAGKAVQGEFRYHNTNTFDPWQGIELWMGYYRNGSADLRQMMMGEISRWRRTFLRPADLRSRCAR